MEPDIRILNFLINQVSIKNHCSYNFLERHGFKINLTDFICYTVGNVGNQKYVNTFKFLGEASLHKLKNFKIKWWNTGLYQIFDKFLHFENIEFWVHSGMTLRKNFFIYDDRMPLFRSTFIYDETSQTIFRLSHIINYLYIPQLDNTNCYIFNSPEKHYIFHKKTKKMIERKEKLKRNLLILPLQKKFIKILENKNDVRIIKKQNIKLFEEINNFINL